MNNLNFTNNSNFDGGSCITIIKDIRQIEIENCTFINNYNTMGKGGGVYLR